jgi:hypothetical protein
VTDTRHAVVTQLRPHDPDISARTIEQRARYDRAHRWPMTDHMNPHYAYYSDANADRAHAWHEKNGCQVGMCATITAAVIRRRRRWWWTR